MKFISTPINGLFLMEHNIFEDERGYFFESFRKDLFEDYLGEKIDFCQENISKSVYGVLRGLHYQLPPYAQSKLVRVVKGEVLDVAVDIRKDSPTFGKHFSVVLNDKNNLSFFIPKGFAHGFVTLSKEAIFFYKVDSYYAPEFDRGIRYDDPSIAIDWRLSKDELILSPKDKNLPYLKDAEFF